MADAKHQPAGPPASGENVTTPAVAETVANIKASKATDVANYKAGRRTR